jgi:hypothetical protein
MNHVIKVNIDRYFLTPFIHIPELIGLLQLHKKISMEKESILADSYM